MLPPIMWWSFNELPDLLVLRGERVLVARERRGVAAGFQARMARWSGLRRLSPPGAHLLVFDARNGSQFCG